MASIAIINESPIEDEKYWSAIVKTERLDEEDNFSQIVADKSTDKAENVMKCDFYMQNNGSKRITKDRFKEDEELSKICQFLIRLFRNWPEQKLETLTGRTFCKIWKLGLEEGLFQNYAERSFERTIRGRILKDQRLDSLVTNEEDRQLILSNLHKLGIGGGHGPKSKHHEIIVDALRFIIRLLRDWPKQRIDEMAGSVLSKIWILGNEEGLFKTISRSDFQTLIRNMICRQRFGKYVENEEEKRLILDNLPILGIALYKDGKSAEMPPDELVESGSLDSFLSYIEAANSSQNQTFYDNSGFNESTNSNVDVALEKIDPSPLKLKLRLEKNQKLTKINRFCPMKKPDPDKKLSKIEKEVKELKKLLLTERKEKEKLSKQIDGLKEDMEKQEKFAYVLQSRINELESQKAV